MSGQLNVAPTLLVSQLELRFSPTEVGDERFLLLKIGQEGTDTPVQVRTEGTDSFQIAVQGSSLRFYSQLNFTPAPGGTFVHVRFVPKQAGQHTAELLIDTSYGTQPIAVSGRTTGLLGRTLTPPNRSQRQQALAAPVSMTQPAHNTSTGSPWLKALVIAGLLGGGGVLAYWWYTNRAALPVSPAVVTTQTTQQEPAPEPIQTTAVRPKTSAYKPVIDKPLSTESVPEENPAPKAATRRARVVEPVAIDPEPEPERVVTERTESNPPPVRNRRASAEPASPAQVEEPSTTVSRLGAPVTTATERVTAEKADKSKKRAVTPVPRPKPVEIPTSESDLERTLNKNQ